MPREEIERNCNTCCHFIYPEQIHLHGFIEDPVPMSEQKIERRFCKLFPEITYDFYCKNLEHAYWNKELSPPSPYEEWSDPYFESDWVSSCSSSSCSPTEESKPEPFLTEEEMEIE